MKLLTYLLQQTARWASVFPQDRSLQRAIALAFGILCGVGRRTLTRAIAFHGNTQKDWSADYKVFSRCPWEPRALFHPILERAIQEQRLQRIVVSTDDTRVWRTGKHVPQTQWHRDPLGPPFQVNLRWGHRFLQCSLSLPLYLQDQTSSSRSVPIRFEMAPVVKKPGAHASDQQLEHYRQLKKQKNLSVQFVALTQEVRQHLNQTGHQAKRLVQVADGSFANRTVFAQDWEAQNVTLIVRCRKDIVLCRRAPGKGRRFYGSTKFTPEQVRRRDSRARWQKAWIFHGGSYRSALQGHHSGLLARSPQTGRAPLGGGAGGLSHQQEGRKYYRQPAYLLTTDLTTPALELLQAYFDRWGIEVNHRDEKTFWAWAKPKSGIRTR